jgi:hypothetical protein
MRRRLLELLHRVQLLEREWQEQTADYDRQRDDRPSPRAADDAVEEDEDRTKDVDQRLQDVGEDHDQIDGAVKCAGNRPGTGRSATVCRGAWGLGVRRFGLGTALGGRARPAGAVQR